MKLFEPEWYRGQAKLDASVDALAHYRSVGVKRGLSPHPLFNASFYLEQAEAQGVTVGECAFTHYLEEGWRRGLNPHPMISTTWLRRQIPGLGDAEPIQHLVTADLDAAPLSPLFHPGFYRRVRMEMAALDGKATAEHFLATGWCDGRPLHPLFSPPAYLLQNPAAANYRYGPAAHYVQHGWSEGLSINPAFDPAWYLRQQPEAGSGDPVLHYLTTGWRAEARPHPLFDAAWYQAQLGPEALSVSHLEHYLEIGWRMGRSPHPLFDLQFYLGKAKGTGDVHPYLHFLAVGDRDGVAAHPLFRPDLYLAWHPDVAMSGQPAHYHYASRGHEQFRRPHPMFDPEHYAWHSPDPEGAAKGGLLHYLKSDLAGRRHPHPLFDAEASRAQSTAQAGVDPLIDYVLHRGALSPAIAGAAWRHPIARRAAERSTRRVQRSEPPLVSVLLPVYSSPQAHLASAIRSVQQQTYANWELVIVDDGSPGLDTVKFCRAQAKADPRIRVFRNEKNGGISAATNTALSKARGEYIAMLDHDDIMRPGALDALVSEVLETGADAAYTDQAYMTDGGAWDGDFHKPDWSPALMAGVMYVGHLLLTRRELAIEVGGFNEDFDRVQDFEFMLRVSERTQRIAHVPAVLYDWRRTPGSIAHSASAKGAIEPVQAAAVNAHFERIGFPGVARPHEHLPHRLRIEPKVKETPSTGVLVVLGGRPEEAQVLASIRHLASSGLSGKLHVLDHEGQAAVAELDEAIATGSETFMVYWDPLASPSSLHFAQFLLMHLVAEDAAFTSLHTCTHDGRVLQAGGMILNGRLKSAMRNKRIGQDGHAGALACDREVSAVLGPFVGARLDHLRQLGGLDREMGSIAGALTEASLRASARGLRNVAVAGAPGVLPPGAPLLDPVDEILIGQKHAATFGERDPYFIPAHDTAQPVKAFA